MEHCFKAEKVTFRGNSRKSWKWRFKIPSIPCKLLVVLRVRWLFRKSLKPCANQCFLRWNSRSGGHPPKITNYLQGIPMFLEKTILWFSGPEVVKTITQSIIPGGRKSWNSRNSTKRFHFCFKKVVQIAPRGHFFTFGSQKLIFPALPGLAKTHKILFAKMKYAEILINVMIHWSKFHNFHHFCENCIWRYVLKQKR